MITFEQAKQLAIEHVKPHVEHLKRLNPEDDLVIQHFTEFDEGWFFLFNSKLFLDTHSVMDRLVGLGPVVIGKESGDIYQEGSYWNLEELINNFKEYLQEKHFK